MGPSSKVEGDVGVGMKGRMSARAQVMSKIFSVCRS